MVAMCGHSNARLVCVGDHAGTGPWPSQCALATFAVRSRSAATQASADRHDTRERKRELGQDKREHAQDLFASEYVWEPVDPTSFTGFDVRTYFGFYSELRSVFALAR